MMVLQGNKGQRAIVKVSARALIVDMELVEPRVMYLNLLLFSMLAINFPWKCPVRWSQLYNTLFKVCTVTGKEKFTVARLR